MFSKTKKTDSPEGLDVRQKELFEHAQARMKEKKVLYRHFVFFLAGCIFMIVLNLVLGFGKEYRFFELDWFVFGVLIWAFFLLVHVLRVVLFSKFMGKAWRDKQMEYLVEKQKEKIAKMQEQLDLQLPKQATSDKKVILDNTDDSQKLQ